jgi:hypothetical protein
MALKYDYTKALQERPNDALEALKDEIREEVRQEFAQEKRQEKASTALHRFFEDFYRKSPEMKRHKYVVSGVFGEHQERLLQMNSNDAMAELYRLVEEHIEQDARRDPDADVMVGGLEHGAPYEPAYEHRQSGSLSKTLRQRREIRRNAGRLA